MSTLAAIGRSGAIGQGLRAIQDFRTQEENIALKRGQQALQGLQMQSVQQDIDIKNRQIETVAQKEAEMLKPRAVEPLMNRFEGGPQGPIAKFVYDMAVEEGVVDLSQGGLGSINQKGIQHMADLLQEPHIASKLSRTRVDYWRGLYNQAQETLSKKPNDKNAMAMLQSAETGLNQSLGQDKALMDWIKANPQDTGDDFTLSPGQKRFDEEGREIAAVDPNAGGADQDVADFEYEMLQEMENEFIQSGTPPAQAKKKALIELERIKREGAIPKEDNISKIKEAYPGIDDETARKIALKTISVKTDPVTGEHTLVDIGSGEQKPLVREQTEPQQEEVQPAQTIFELSDLVAGPESAAKAGASIVSGMVGGPISEQTIQARQFVVTAKNDLIRALSINPRFPVGEIKRIEKEINIEPKIFDNPKVFKSRVIAINKYLTRRVRKETQIANDPTMPKQARQDAKIAAANIGSFIKLLGAPPQVESIEDYDQILEGTQYIDPTGKIRVKGAKQ